METSWRTEGGVAVDRPRYRIHHVAEMTGVHPSTLRAWERRYGLLKPQRTAAGHRLYSEEEVERVRRVSKLAAEGTPYTRIAELLEQLERPAAWPTAAAGPGLVASLREGAERHTFTFDSPGLEALYSRALGIFSFEEAFERVFLPLLGELGERWLAGEDNVAEEHFLSMFARRKVLAYINSLPVRRLRPRVICASAPEDPHEIGLLFFTLKLIDRGVPVIYIGPCTPPDSLLHVARSTDAAVVCLSTTLTESSPALIRLVGELVSLPGPRAVIVGGQGSTALGGELPPEARIYGEDAEAGVAEVLAAAPR